MAMTADNGRDFFVKDFYIRTLHILNNYKGDYDVTLLINSMLGLLVVPKEKFWREMDDFQISNEISSLTNNIQENTYPGDQTIKNIVKHLRNAVAHGKMTIFGEESNYPGAIAKINTIEFIDEKNPYRFVIRFTVEELKNFLIDFATNISENHYRANERR